MWKTLGNKTTGRKFDLQTKHVADSWNCKTNKDPQAKPDKGSSSKEKNNFSDYLNSSKMKTNMLDYFISSDNKEADKEQVTQSQIEYTMNLMTFSLV